MSEPIKFSPAFIFEKEFRLSARKRKIYSTTVLVENNLAERVWLKFQCNARWIDIAYDAETNSLEVPANGQAQFEIRIDDTSPFFPKNEGIDTEVEIVCETVGARWKEEFPICLESITTAPFYQGIVAIDFGTTNSSIAVIDSGTHVPRVLGLEANSKSIASGILFESVHPKDQPTYSIGSDATTKLRSAESPTDAYIVSAKRLLGTNAKKTLQNNKARGAGQRFTTYTYDEISRFIIEKLISLGEEQLRKDTIQRVVVTYPTMFSQPRVKALRRVFKELGFEDQHVQMGIDEASAAGLWFLDREVRDRYGSDIASFVAHHPQPFVILAYDFGGGTIDVSLMKITPHDRGEQRGARYDIAVEILGYTGDPLYGGDNVTREVFKLLKWRLAQVIGRYKPTDDITAPGAESLRDRIDRAREWLARPDVGEEIESAIQNGRDLDGGSEIEDHIETLVPTRYEAYKGDTKSRAWHLFYELWRLADEIKIELCKAARAGDNGRKCIVSLPSLWTVNVGDEEICEVGLTMHELEMRIREPIHRTLCRARALHQYIAVEQKRCPETIAQVILAGQSSNLPVVAEELGKVLGQGGVFEPGAAKSSVAIGASLADRLNRHPGLYRFHIDTLIDKVPYDIGYMREGIKKLQRIFALGAKLPATAEVPFDGDCLELFSEVGNSDNDPAERIYLGKFDFATEPLAQPGDRWQPTASDEAQAEAEMSGGSGPGTSTPTAGRKSWFRFGAKPTPPARPSETPPPQLSRKPMADSPPPKAGRPSSRGASVTVVYTSDREIYADRGGRRWPLILPYEANRHGGDGFLSGTF